MDIIKLLEKGSITDAEYQAIHSYYLNECYLKDYMGEDSVDDRGIRHEYIFDFREPDAEKRTYIFYVDAPEEDSLQQAEKMKEKLMKALEDEYPDLISSQKRSNELFYKGEILWHLERVYKGVVEGYFEYVSVTYRRKAKEEFNFSRKILDSRLFKFED